MTMQARMLDDMNAAMTALAATPCADAGAAPPGRRLAALSLGLLAVGAAIPGARAADVYLPIVMPISGFMSVEGGSQLRGMLL